MANYDDSRYTYAQVVAGNGYYQKDDLLRYSAGVKTMQEKLNKAGHNCGTPDGKFGNNTHNAVYSFQVAQGLICDYKAGKNTLARLDTITSGGGSTTGDAATMRNNIVTEAAYWIGKILYCLDSVVTNTMAQIKRGVSVSVNSMQPGDLILYDWKSDGKPNHVGICSAKDKMIDEHGKNNVALKLAEIDGCS